MPTGWQTAVSMGDVYQKNGAIRLMTEPSPTLTASIDNGNFRWIPTPADPTSEVSIHGWVEQRPATTVVGTFAPDVMAAPGYRTTVSRQKAPGSVRITVTEAGVLQGFPADWKWPEKKGKAYLAAGNAVCPPVQKAITESLIASIKENQ